MRLKNRKSWTDEQDHIYDNFTNIGYKYWERGILNKVLSYELFSNPNQDSNYRQIERLIIYLINTAKQIRTQFSIAHNKDTILIN